MVDALQSDETETANDGWSLAREVSRLSGVIAACDRLCLLSARSLVQCATKVTKDGGHQSVTFIPSVSRDVRTVDDREEHPTTSAQCVAALQRLLPVVGRFRLGTQESREPAFHPIERSALEVFDPRQLSREIGNKLNQALASLHEPAPRLTNGGIDFRDDAARDILTSTAFRYLHPFTAARILRAIAPSQGMYGNVWWRSLFVVLWFINRRGGSLRGYPNIQATKCPGTAFLTGQCVDAIVTVLDVFRRRRDRFKRLIELMSDLANIDAVREHINQFSCQGALSKDIFSRGYDFKGRALAPEIQQCIDELALDSALPVTYKRWQEDLAMRPKMLNEFCVSVVDSFIATLNREDVSDEHKLIQLVAGNGVTHAKLIRDRVKDIHDIISYKLNPEKGKAGLRPITPDVFDQYKFILPDWICSDDYWSSTRKEVADLSTASQDDRHRPFLMTLETHWHRHRDASANAAETVELFSKYLSVVLTDFDKFRRHFAGLERSKTESIDSAEFNRRRVRDFLNSFSDSPDHLSFLREQLLRDVETGVRWAEVLTNRHLALAAGGALSQFDPGELSHALRIVCRHDHKVRFDLVLTALETLCQAQRPDGAWISQQPFHWTKTGSLSLTLSVETAEAIVSSVNMLLRNPQRYGVSLEECSARLQPIYSALGHFFEWLSGSMQSFSKPAALESHDKPESQPPLYGWCSDRVYEQGRIHSWATAAAIEFLVAFRRLQQERINSLLRSEFLSYHPEELKPLLDVGPTDLRKLQSIDSSPVIGPSLNERAPVILQLSQLLREHKRLELFEGPWLAMKPEPEPEISFWSGIFYGPPGTSKTFLAKAIAGELRWPLISLSPADFLSKGAQQIEARAKEIFSALGSGSRLVYFFDEIDELIRDRRQTEKEQRSAFSFLTPSFLTKLQEFRGAARNNEFIFILATNYYDRIDTAAKRTGRIDREFPIVYPDCESRGYIILQYLLKQHGFKVGAVTESHIEKLQGNLAALQAAWSKALRDWEEIETTQGSERFVDFLAKFTGFLSYQKIQEFLDVNRKLSTAEITDGDLKSLTDELDDIDLQQSTRFRPEIKLSDYSDRPEAIDEIREVVDVFPSDHFPRAIRGSAESLGRHVDRQLADLYAKADPAFRSALQRAFPKHREWLKLPEEQ